MIKTGWIDSDADFKSSRTEFKGRTTFISIKLLAKYVLITYVLAFVSLMHMNILGSAQTQTQTQTRI